jgi:hypothetical protein
VDGVLERRSVLEPGRFFWATQNVAPADPKVSRPATYTGA